MNQMVTVQEGAPAKRSALQVLDTVPILDTARFEHMQRIALAIARSNMIPESLTTFGKVNDKKELAFEVIVANVFLVVNQAVRWGMDPFAVLSSAALVHGKLCYEGKLVAAVLEAKLGVQLDPVWNDERGEAFGIRITGTLPSGKVREVQGTVGEWKTSGSNSPWSNPRRQLLYRGTREWARWWAPGLLLGVYTDDELSDLQDIARAQRALPVPSQQEQVAQIAGQPKPAARRAPPEPEPEAEEVKPAEKKPDPVAEVKLDQKRRGPPEPDPEDTTDWPAELKGYGDRLSGVESHEELAEVIEAHGSVFSDASAEIRSAATKLEDERRDAIGEDTVDHGTAPDPAAAIYDEMHMLISDGLSYLAARNKLDPAKLALLSNDQVVRLKAVEAQKKGGEN